MGVDMWAMPEISHNGEPWRPLRHSKDLYSVPREQALFALLGDVTNGKGRFSNGWQPESEHQGVTVPGFWYKPDEGDHDPIEPIKPPTGVLADSSDVWLGHVAYWQNKREKIVVTCLTIDEIVGGNWDQPVYRHGILSEEDYLAYNERGLVPHRWFGQVGGPAVGIVNEIEYAAGKRGERETFVNARWNAGSIRDNSKGFIEGLEALTEMRPETSRLRIQMLFEA